jgi:hypothetical protein
MSDGYALARIRVLGLAPVPASPADVDTMRIAANRAGRRLVHLSGADGALAVALGWQEGDEPAVLQEPLVDIYRHASPTVQLVLAACVRCCWPDPDQPLYPGETATEAQVFRALDSLGTRMLSADLEEANNGVHRARKSALRVLRACAFLASDTSDGAIRLGPAIAQWTPADIAELRRGHDFLPSPDEVPM